MELIIINRSKLKIILSKQDLQDFGIKNNFECVAENGAGFRKIMEWVNTKTDKIYSQRKTVVTVFPSKDGGCELFVNLVTDSEKEKSEQSSLNNTYRISQNPPQKLQDSTLCIVVFDNSFENILSLCKALRERSYPFNSSLYVAENNNYILVLYYHGNKQSVVFKKAFYNYKQIVSEYAQSYSTTLQAEFVDEHCKAICKQNAIQLFGKVFS